MSCPRCIELKHVYDAHYTLQNTKLNALKAENKELQQTLREYEHETETIKEMKDEVSQLTNDNRELVSALEYAQNQLWHNYDFFCARFHDDHARHTADVHKIATETLTRVRGEK